MSFACNLCHLTDLNNSRILCHSCLCMVVHGILSYFNNPSQIFLPCRCFCLQKVAITDEYIIHYQIDVYANKFFNEEHLFLKGVRLYCLIY